MKLQKSFTFKPASLICSTEYPTNPTIPKIKIYITAYGMTRKESEDKTALMSEDATKLLGV